VGIQGLTFRSHGLVNLFMVNCDNVLRRTKPSGDRLVRKTSWCIAILASAHGSDNLSLALIQKVCLHFQNRHQLFCPSIVGLS
jgi:hypothetical protein